jgi:hypothetical protein
MKSLEGIWGNKDQQLERRQAREGKWSLSHLEDDHAALERLRGDEGMEILEGARTEDPMMDATENKELEGSLESEREEHHDECGHRYSQVGVKVS